MLYLYCRWSAKRIRPIVIKALYYYWYFCIYFNLSDSSKWQTNYKYISKYFFAFDFNLLFKSVIDHLLRGGFLSSPLSQDLRKVEIVNLPFESLSPHITRRQPNKATKGCFPWLSETELSACDFFWLDELYHLHGFCVCVCCFVLRCVRNCVCTK